MSRDFASAYDALLTTISTGPALVAKAKRRRATVQEMDTYMRQCGLEVAMQRMRYVHVAGSKGKGSTCAMVESLLRHHYLAAGVQVGLFTSPHLVSPVERIWINGKPIAEEAFARAVWSVWDCLHTESSLNAEGLIPGFFQCMTLVCLRAWADAGVDIGVVEVGMGGRFDATNVLPVSAVLACGINTLELEHTQVLGDTLAQIAWEKGGILRGVAGDISSSPAWFTIPQEEEAAQVLTQCAREGGGDICAVTPFSVAQVREMLLPGDEQTTGMNAALAVALARAATSRFNNPSPHLSLFSDPLPEASEIVALKAVKWPGRAQRLKVIDWPNVEFCLDGAHTDKSMAACARWYQSVKEKVGSTCKTYLALLFGCAITKNPVSLLRMLSHSGLQFDLALFTCASEGRPSTSKPPCLEELIGPGAMLASVPIDGGEEAEGKAKQEHIQWSRTMASVFLALQSESESGEGGNVGNRVMIEPSIMDALLRLKEVGKTNSVLVLVTGSLYTVGEVLTKLEWSPAEFR